jgi:hypothetical protein
MGDDILDMSDETSDEEFFLNGNERSIKEALESVEGLLSTIYENSDFELGANALRSLYAAGRAIGYSTVKLCHGMHLLWIKEGRDPEQFWGWMQDTTPLKRITIERYIKAWDAYLELGDSRLLTRPTKDLVALGSAMSQGYEVSQEDVEKLLETKSNGEFLGTIREIKGAEPRKNSITLYLETDGTINAWTKDGVVYVGYLDTKGAINNDTLDKCITRITRSAGLIVR